MVSSAARASLLALLLTLKAFSAEVEKLSIHIEKGVTVNINSNTRNNNCKVCTKTTFRRNCADARQFRDTSVLVELECPKLQDIFTEFTVKIERDIECTRKSCNGHIIQTDSSFSLLLAFNRTFTWNLKASQQTTFKVDFSKTGLRQIRPSEICPDRHSYTLQTSQTTGSVSIGKYCRGGSISTVQIQNNGRFSVEVPAGQKLQKDQFNVSVGEETKSLAKITLTFPEGTSSSELFSPNYPDSFPNSSVIEWDIQVPDKHKTSVQFLNVTQPRCLKDATAMEYHSEGRAALVKSLTDPQHSQDMGNVSLMLRNCEMDEKRSSSSGLSVNLRVSASITRPPDMTIILTVGTAVLAIFVLVAVVVCVMMKKKAEKQNQQTSVYSPHISTSVLPGHSSPPDPCANDDHVYASIDDTKVYSYLLEEELQYTEFNADGPSGHATAVYIEVIGGN